VRTKTYNDFIKGVKEVFAAAKEDHLESLKYGSQQDRNNLKENG